MYAFVSVYPNAKKEVVTKTGEHRYEAQVKEPPERNLANRRVLELMALEYQVPVTALRLVSGHHHGRKMISIRTEVL